MDTSFLSKKQITNIGFKKVGKNIKISKEARFYKPELISMGDNIRIDDFCILSGAIEIGSYIHIAAYSSLYGRGGIVLKDFSGLSARVTIYSATDDYSGNYLTNPTVPEKYTNVFISRVIIEKHVIVGAGSVILPGVILHEGSAIGAMSLVKDSMPEWMICVGIPAEPVKKREKTIIELENELLLQTMNEKS